MRTNAVIFFPWALMSGRPSIPADVSTYRGQWGANLRKLRCKVFDTQQKFADALESNGIFVSKQTISQWEHGRRTPPVECFPVIAAVLSCRIGALLPKYESGTVVENTRYGGETSKPIRTAKKKRSSAKTGKKRSR